MSYEDGKVENISSFVEAGLMAVSCAWIIGEALSRMVNHTVELHHSFWPVLVLLTSIAVDYWRSQELRRVARRASRIGTRFGVDWLRYADPFAAIVVLLMILRMTLQLTRHTVGALTDQIPAETRNRLISEVEGVEGVLRVEQARVRHSGAAYFADLTR